MCCNSWGRKDSDTTEQLNQTVPHLVTLRGGKRGREGRTALKEVCSRLQVSTGIAHPTHDMPFALLQLN